MLLRSEPETLSVIIEKCEHALMHLHKMVSMGKCHVLARLFWYYSRRLFEPLECRNDDSMGTKQKWLSNQRRFLATSLPVMPAEEFEEEYEQRNLDQLWVNRSSQELDFGMWAAQSGMASADADCNSIRQTLNETETDEDEERK